MDTEPATHPSSPLHFCCMGVEKNSQVSHQSVGSHRGEDMVLILSCETHFMEEIFAMDLDYIGVRLRISFLCDLVR